MASADKSYSEKRDFIRMRINSQVIICQGDNEYQGICKDLSGTGMLVETDQLFAIGDELDISIKQKGENQLPFNATAEVLRAEANGTAGYTIGLTIKEIV